MLQSISRRVIPVFAAVLAFGLPSFADFVFDNFDDGDNKNALGQYWYYVVDGYGSTDASKIAIVTNYSDPFVPTADGNGGSAFAAAMNFTGLSSGTDQNASIAIGSEVSKNTGGIGSAFAGVTGVSFYAKGPSGLAFRFVVETIEVGGGTGQSWDAYGKNVTIASADANSWKKYDVNFSELAREWDNNVTFAFNKEHVTKFSWQIKKSVNTVTSGTFAIDSVVLLGTFDPGPGADVCVTCVASTFGAPDPSALLSDFDGASGALQNKLGEYWYKYADPASTAGELSATAAGQGGSGFAATVGVNVGSAEIRFAGLGTNLAKTDSEKYFDATAFSGIYFEYKTAGANLLKVMLLDKASVVAENGEDFYIMLQGTSGAWRSATIPFGTFILPDWASQRSLSKAELGKIQIAATVAGIDTITVDNVYLTGAASLGIVQKYTLKYLADGADGSLSVNGAAGWVQAHTVEVPEGGTGPSVEAMPTIGKRFLRWSDGYANAARTDVAVRDSMLTALFEEVVPETFTLTYTAGDGGSLRVGGADAAEQTLDTSVVVLENAFGPAVTAVPDAGYKFAGWSDGFAAAARTGDRAVRDSTMTARFEVDSITVTYNAGSGGNLLIGGQTYKTYSFKGKLNDNVDFPVTAVADSDYEFVHWSDGGTDAARAVDVVLKDTTFTASFVPVLDPDVDPEAEFYTLEYSVTAGGKLELGGETDVSFVRRVEKDSLGPAVKAVANDGYRFIGWDDGRLDTTRADIAVMDSTITALFEAEEVSVAQNDRIVPPSTGSEVVVVAPVAVVAGEFTVGPNPAAKQSGGVKFFWSGRAVKSGKLSVFDASGSLVKRVSVSEVAALGASKRAVGSWDLKDAKGRPVAEGTYLVKGAIVTQSGAKVKVSAVVGVR